MNKEPKEYLHLVRLAFPTFQKQEKRFYTDFCSSVYEYTESNPDCTQEELLKLFGQPKDIIIMYYSNMETDVYYTILKRVRYIRYTFIACLIALFIMFITTFCFYQSAMNKYDHATVSHIDVDINESINN